MARELIERIDDLGGAVAAIEAGFVQREIEDAAFEHERLLEAGERVVVGVNRYEEADEEEIELHRLDPESERRQVERTARVRAERDADRASAALAAVRETARGTGTCSSRCARRLPHAARSARSPASSVRSSARTTPTSRRARDDAAGGRG